MQRILWLAMLMAGIAVADTTVGQLEPAAGSWRVYRGTRFLTFVCSAASEDAAKLCAAADVEARKTSTRYQLRYPNRYLTIAYSAPIADADSDGVPDSADKCPSVPASTPDGCPIVTPPPSGIPAPSSSSTIVWDTRKGGAQSYERVTSFSQMLGVYGAIRSSNRATQFFETNVDGNGTNARGCQLESPNGSEQECYFGTEGGKIRAPSSGWYTQFKVHLGKSPTGSGSGPLNTWTLAGGNPHQKIFIWTRATGGDRLYLAIMPNQINIRCDGRNFNSPLWTANPYGKTGVQIITIYIRPETGTIRAWIGEKQVADASGLNIGTSGLVDIQETVTTFPGQQEVQYLWDTVVWY